VAAFAAAGSAIASAQTPIVPPGAMGGDGWTFHVEPFLWIPSLDGSGSADSSPTTSLTNPEFDAGFLLAFEAQPHGGGVGFLADGLYVRLADDEGTLRTRTEVEMFEAGIAWPLTEQRTWELLAGARWVDLDYEVAVGGALSGDASATWVDPWFGGRGRFPLGERWIAGVRGDIGGFGVGTQFTWQALATVGWQCTEHLRVDLGYRALSLDFDDDDLDYNAIVYGPLVGLDVRF
jgi:hypothetical protein